MYNHYASNAVINENCVNHDNVYKSIDFILDSGATDTMFGNYENFIPNSISDCKVIINSADKNNSLYSNQMGGISLPRLLIVICNEIRLCKVLHVPNL